MPTVAESLGRHVRKLWRVGKEYTADAWEEADLCSRIG